MGLSLTPQQPQRQIVLVFRTFVAGVILGLVACAAALYLVPAVDQHREASLIAVSPNGGTTETFHINVPIDRIMTGSTTQREPLPPGLQWPDNPLFAATTTELFKVRNSKDAVIGVASRLAADDPEIDSVVEWTLHLPARGSLFATMQVVSAGDAARRGALRAGTREFRGLRGELTERWIRNTAVADAAGSGRLELIARYASSRVEAP